MKIGIVTLYKAYNYGAYYQAYALYTYLKQAGHKVYFVKHNARKPWRKLIRLYFEACKKGWNEEKQVSAAILWGIIRGQKRFLFCRAGKTPKLDVVIFGSDEIWDITRTANSKYPILYGEGIKTRKISYAPSANASTKDDFINNQSVINQFKTFTAISARDAKSSLTLSEVIGKPVETVIDPSQLLSLDYYRTIETSINIDDEYLLVYSYGFAINEETKREIISFAQRNSLKTLSILTCFDWCDINKGLDPFQSLYVFDKAKYVVTDTYHGIMMSLKYKKEFAILPYLSTKNLDVIETFSLQERLVVDNNRLDIVMNKSVDYGTIDIVMDKCIKKSEDYLKKNLLCSSH